MSTNTTTDQKLSHAQVLAAARRLGERDGLAGVTMRRIAADLGRSTMAAYRHLDGGRDGLVAELLDEALSRAVKLRQADRDRWLSGLVGLVGRTIDELATIDGLHALLPALEMHDGALLPSPTDWPRGFEFSAGITDWFFELQSRVWETSSGGVVGANDLAVSIVLMIRGGASRPDARATVLRTVERLVAPPVVVASDSTAAA